MMKLSKRHIKIDSIRTSIAIENEFWLVLDSLANKSCLSWQEWALNAIKEQTNKGRASALRVAVLQSACA